MFNNYDDRLMDHIGKDSLTLSLVTDQTESEVDRAALRIFTQMMNTK